MTPVWGTLRFYRVLGALVTSAAHGWQPVLVAPGPYLPCVAPERAEAFASGARPFGIASPPGGGAPAPGRAAVLTHDAELAGRIPISELQNEVRRLSGRAGAA